MATWVRWSVSNKHNNWPIGIDLVEMNVWIKTVIRFGCLSALALFACAEESVHEVHAPEVSGSSMLINLTPTNRLSVVGALDFELLDEGVGKACVDRGGDKKYWVGMSDVAKLASDELSRQAISAAITDAVSRLDDTDTILLTRVLTESKGPDRICASIVGRGVRLTKAVAHTLPAATPLTPTEHQ